MSLYYIPFISIGLLVMQSETFDKDIFLIKLREKELVTYKKSKFGDFKNESHKKTGIKESDKNIF